MLSDGYIEDVEGKGSGRRQCMYVCTCLLLIGYEVLPRIHNVEVVLCKPPVILRVTIMRIPVRLMVIINEELRNQICCSW